jgi:hypothetical protein
MRISFPELEISPEEGFDPTKDIFERKRFGEGLTHLLSRLEQPAVIALDAPWGSGKTTFVRMWEGHLRHHGFPAIRFDAFYNDYQQDAFAAVAGEVIAYAKRLQVADSNQAAEFRKQAVKVGKVLLRGAARLGVKAGTLGALDYADVEALGGITDDLAAAASSVTDDFVRARLEKHDEDRATFETFRSRLAEVAAILPGNDPKSAPTTAPSDLGEYRPLIFIIDELDRCRPTYSLAILETIKHFFSVTNVHFVLVTHMDQLAASVAYAYGSGVDAPTYLQKFYTFAVQLPEQSDRRSTPAVQKYIEALSRSLVPDAEMKNQWGEVTQFLQIAAEQMRLSLRTVERIATLCALVIGYSKPNRLMIPTLVGGLCVMKVVRPAMYLKARDGSLHYDEVEGLFHFSSWLGSRGEQRAPAAEFWWRWSTAPGVEGEEAARRTQSLQFNYDIDEPRSVLPILAFQVVDRFMLPPDPPAQPR